LAATDALPIVASMIEFRYIDMNTFIKLMLAVAALVVALALAQMAFNGVKVTLSGSVNQNIWPKQGPSLFH
jgi:hypothetical protein